MVPPRLPYLRTAATSTGRTSVGLRVYLDKGADERPRGVPNHSNEQIETILFRLDAPAQQKEKKEAAKRLAERKRPTFRLLDITYTDTLLARQNRFPIPPSMVLCGKTREGEAVFIVRTSTNTQIAATIRGAPCAVLCVL